jgi:hypothetical protein
MTFVEGSSDGVTTATTPVAIVAAPAAVTRRIIKNVTIANPMASESVVLTYYMLHAAAVRIIWKGTLAGGETLIDDSVRVLDDVDKSLMVVLGGTPTTELDFSAAWGDSA